MHSIQLLSIFKVKPEYISKLIFCQRSPVRPMFSMLDDYIIQRLHFTVDKKSTFFRIFL